MKNAKHVNYLQIDNNVQICEEQDVVVLSSAEAYNKLEWSRGLFDARPKEGYFIWIKESIEDTLITNILMCSMYAVQKTTNLVVLEEDVQAKLKSTCASSKKFLYGKHFGNTKIILKENAKLEMNSFHRWGKYDTIESKMELILKKNAEAIFTQKCHDVPANLKMRNSHYLDENSSLNFVTTVLAKQGKVEMYDDTYLNGKNANGLSRVRMICRKKSQIDAYSNMIGNKAGTGHLDCMGLLLCEDASIIAEPKLINKNKDASLTHEASVGKISEDVLNYLRSRGLTEDQAIDLVVNGFLGDEEEIIIDGSNVSSKLYM
jgi:Fe-S cluster assembly scaffold protein SufB